MGADIHSFAEVKKEGKWIRVTEEVFDDFWDNQKTSQPFGIRNYRIFAFLADVRNGGGCIPISDPKGLPDDSEYLNIPLKEPQRYSYFGYDNGIAYTNKGDLECDINYHSHSWLTVKELLDFDYDKSFIPDSNTESYREVLGDFFFNHLETLKHLGDPENVRVVFWFDS